MDKRSDDGKMIIKSMDGTYWELQRGKSGTESLDLALAKPSTLPPMRAITMQALSGRIFHQKELPFAALYTYLEMGHCLLPRALEPSKVR